MCIRDRPYNDYDNSFDYQVKQAKAAYSAGNINSEVSYYEKALSIDSDNTDVRFALADIYMSKKDYDAAPVSYTHLDVYKRQVIH